MSLSKKKQMKGRKREKRKTNPKNNRGGLTGEGGEREKNKVERG